jgi:hypothetical protein
LVAYSIGLITSSEEEVEEERGKENGRTGIYKFCHKINSNFNRPKRNLSSLLLILVLKNILN